MFFFQILVNVFSSAINVQNSRVDQLDKDTLTLADDINTLKDQVMLEKLLRILLIYQHNKPVLMYIIGMCFYLGRYIS